MASATIDRIPTQRDVQREATRLAVIEAATGMFAARGFEGATLPSIAAACGTPVPLIVYHFKSKDGLWRACVDEIYRRISEHLASYEARIAAATGYAYFRESIRAQITALAAHPAYMRIVFQEGTQSSPRLEWMVERHQNRITERIVALIEQAQAAGYLPAMDALHAKFVLSGAFCFPIVLAAEYRIVTGEDPEAAAFIEKHIDMCMNLIMPGGDMRTTP